MTEADSRIRWITSIVCNEHNIEEKLLFSDRRSSSVADARHLTFYLIYTLTSYSVRYIAKTFKKDTTTVLYGFKKIERTSKYNPVLKRKLARLKEKIESGADQSVLMKKNKSEIDTRAS